MFSVNSILNLAFAKHSQKLNKYKFADDNGGLIWKPQRKYFYV